MTKIILIAGVVLIVILGAFIFFQPEEAQSPADPEEVFEDEAMMEDEGAMMEDDGMVKNMIVYSDSGYAPKELTIQAGDTVTFRNESTRMMWPASAMHPSHTEYPGSSIQKCFDGSDIGPVFDACQDIAQGGEWSFTFQENGSWNYHDHRRSSDWGTVNVE
jgi:plastocyanin